MLLTLFYLFLHIHWAVELYKKTRQLLQLIQCLWGMLLIYEAFLTVPQIVVCLH
jgi:hypothetical protein